jgi:hypothetical protein
MDLRALIEKMDEIESAVVEQTGTPTQFTPTHFHKNNLGGKMPLMKTPDNKWWWISQTTDASGMPGPQGIVPWNGNTENRSSWNPASVDGEIKNGKYIDYPEGTTWKTSATSATPTTSATANVPGVQNDRAQAGPATSTPPAQSGMSADNSAEMTKIKELEKLVDQYIELRSKVNESQVSIAKTLVESFGYQYNLDYLTEQDAAAISTYGGVDFGKFLQGGKNLAKGIVRRAATPVAAAVDAWDAWKEIQALDEKTMSVAEWKEAVTRIVSQLIASIGLFWAGAILGALAGSAIVPGLGTIGGLIVGGVSGAAAGHVLGDDLETIVDALVDKLYNNSASNQQSTAPTAQEPAANVASSNKLVVGDEDIVAIQMSLKKDGHDLGKTGPNGDGIDGKIGPKTISAIQQDLAKLGAKNPDGSPLSVTGIGDEVTGQAIQKYYRS